MSPYMVLLPGAPTTQDCIAPTGPHKEKYLVVESNGFYAFIVQDIDTPPEIVGSHDTYAQADAQRNALNKEAGLTSHPLREQMEMEFNTLGVSPELAAWTIPPEDRKGLHVGLAKQLDDGSWSAVHEATGLMGTGTSLQDAAYGLFAERMHNDRVFCAEAEAMYPDILFDNYI